MRHTTLVPGVPDSLTWAVLTLAYAGRPSSPVPARLPRPRRPPAHPRPPATAMPPRSSAPAQLRSEPAERLTAHEAVISDRYAMLPGHQGYYVFLAAWRTDR